MELDEAADLFREIVDRCPGLKGRHFLITTEVPPARISTGYEIIIRYEDRAIDEITKKALYDIADKKGLRIIESSSTFSIYTPTQEQKKLLAY